MEAIQYKCPNCGGELIYKADKQNFACEYCYSEYTEVQIKEIFEENESKTLDQNSQQQAQDEFNNHTNIYHCGSCGAEVISEENTAATFCYYCHEPVILSGRLSDNYRPNRVIGFSLDRDSAERIFKKWCWNKWFIPKDFKTNKQMEKMTGLYVPFWLADCKINSSYNGLGKKIRSWTSGSYRYTETTEYDIVRKAKITLKGIPADGASKIDDSLMEAIEPFNYDSAKDFSMSYLSGFFADKYDVEKKDMFPRIRERATQASAAVIKSSISGYTSVLKHSENHNVLNTNWEYILMPVWFMTYKYKDKVYSFALNGQTGKIAGTPPLNTLKAILFSCGYGAIALILTLLWGYLFG